MGKQSALVIVFTVGLLACPTAASARIIEDWPYDKLFRKADLVVLAAPVKTEAADDKPIEHSLWGSELVPQNTTLRIRHVLKGKVKGRQIKVLHFKFGGLRKGVDPGSLDASVIIDGPNLVVFRTRSVLVTAGKDKQILRAPEYLLFLKRMTDGRYEPVSGRIDPALSVREVSEPLGKPLGGGQ